jgi:hypothetical protein
VAKGDCNGQGGSVQRQGPSCPTRKLKEDPAARESRRRRSARPLEREKTNPNPKIWLCIPCCEYHLYLSEGQGSEYIYIYRRGRIYKEPLEKYNNRKCEYISAGIDMSLG